MQAAFFDLDKTVIARASMVAFGRPLHRAGYLSRWLVLRALWGQLVYLYLGADEARLARMREAALALTRGWDHAHISAVVEEALEEVVEPIIFDEALELIRHHQAEGHLVVIVSASPQEIVAPLARYLGVERTIATRARLDGLGRYSGELEFYAYGPHKADAIRGLAAEVGIDLEASYAYSDSATDVPMLECVGHAVVVNPDRELLRVARERAWEVRRFVKPVRLRDRVSMPPAAPTAVGGGVTAAVLAAAVVVWWRLRREPPAPVPARAARRVGGAARTAGGAASRLTAGTAARLGRITPRAASWPRGRRGR